MTEEAVLVYDIRRDIIEVEVPSLGYRFPIDAETAATVHEGLGRFLAGERPIIPPRPPDPIRALHAAVGGVLKHALARLDHLNATAEERWIFDQAREAAGLPRTTVAEWERISGGPAPWGRSGE